MRHLVHTAKLNRNCGHRKAMLVNLACSLIEHESIQTTTIRAKELRRFVERLITMAKAGGDHKRRLAYAKLKINTPSEFAQTKKLVLAKLGDDLIRIIRIAVLYHIGDTIYKNGCLSRACTRKNEQRPVNAEDSAPLHGIHSRKLLLENFFSQIYDLLFIRH